jgi:hypothetical protein
MAGLVPAIHVFLAAPPRPSFFAIEFPENRENNREFAVFLTGLAIFDIKSRIHFNVMHTNSLQIKNREYFSPEQGIDPTEQE